MKICKHCKETKTENEFGKNSSAKNGVGNICKECLKEKMRVYRNLTNNAVCKKYEKTKKGFLMRMYRNMQSRIKGIQWRKQHLYCGKELLDRQVFYEWALNNENFHTLFERYKESNFDRKLAPSVDRVDSSKGYTLDNMEFVTHSENSRRGATRNNGNFHVRNLEIYNNQIL